MKLTIKRKYITAAKLYLLAVIADGLTGHGGDWYSPDTLAAIIEQLIPIGA